MQFNEWPTFGYNHSRYMHWPDSRAFIILNNPTIPPVQRVGKETWDFVSPRLCCMASFPSEHQTDETNRKAGIKSQNIWNSKVPFGLLIAASRSSVKAEMLVCVCVCLFMCMCEWFLCFIIIFEHIRYQASFVDRRFLYPKSYGIIWRGKTNTVQHKWISCSQKFSTVFHHTSL